MSEELRELLLLARRDVQTIAEYRDSSRRLLELIDAALGKSPSG